MNLDNLRSREGPRPLDQIPLMRAICNALICLQFAPEAFDPDPLSEETPDRHEMAVGSPLRNLNESESLRLQDFCRGCLASTTIGRAMPVGT